MKTNGGEAVQLHAFLEYQSHRLKTQFALDDDNECVDNIWKES
jgi:hypothetical protein